MVDPENTVKLEGESWSYEAAPGSFPARQLSSLASRVSAPPAWPCTQVFPPISHTPWVPLGPHRIPCGACGEEDFSDEWIDGGDSADRGKASLSSQVVFLGWQDRC